MVLQRNSMISHQSSPGLMSNISLVRNKWDMIVTPIFPESISLS